MNDEAILHWQVDCWNGVVDVVTVFFDAVDNTDSAGGASGAGVRRGWEVTDE